MKHLALGIIQIQIAGQARPNQAGSGDEAEEALKVGQRDQAPCK